MEREVELSITGLQSGPEQKDQMRTFAKAEYFKKKDTHYILYEEQWEDQHEMPKSRIKAAPGKVELVRRGALATHMVFEEHKKHMTSYGTPFGNILLGIETESVEICETETQLVVKVAYSLEMNGEPASDCQIELRIQDRI